MAERKKRDMTNGPEREVKTRYEFTGAQRRAQNIERGRRGKH